MAFKTVSAATARAAMNRGKVAAPVTPSPLRTNKYNAVKVETENGRYDSKHEARRIEALYVLQQCGQIQGLERQPVYELVVNGVKIGKYKGDARFMTLREVELQTLNGPRVFPAGVVILVDAKGMKTPVYKLKCKLMLACHGIEVIEL